MFFLRIQFTKGGEGASSAICATVTKANVQPPGGRVEGPQKTTLPMFLLLKIP